MKDNLEGIVCIFFWLSIVSLFAMCVGYIIQIQIDEKQKQKEAILQNKIDSLQLIIKLNNELKK